MELGTSELAEAASGDLHIPIDLFGSKKHAGVPRGVLAFADASGNIVFSVHRHPPNPNSSPPPKDHKLLLDASGNPLFSIHRHQVSQPLFLFFPSLSKKKRKKKEIPRVIFTFFFVFWQNGSWKCYKGSGDKELVFRVQRTLKTLTRVELEVFFAGTERSNDGDGCDLKVRGSPFQRSCNIYKDADLVAQVHKK